MIEFEKEVVEYLGIPNIPIKEWDNLTPFDKGVAVIKMKDERLAYAVCSYNPDKGNGVAVTKVFGIEPFVEITKVFIVPNYITNIADVDDMDLDEDSKKRAKEVLQEAAEFENEDVSDEDTPSSEYYFENITNDEEAVAFIKTYNKRNKIRQKPPRNHEAIIMRLAVIYSEQNKK